MSDRIAIRLRNVSVEYRPFRDQNPTLRRTIAAGRARSQNTVTALNGVDLEIGTGEAFAIIGPNGAGKSTLMRVLARTLRPDRGEVEVRGRTSTLLQLGVGFNSQLSGERNVYLGGLAAGLTKSEIDGRFDDIVQYAELEDAIDRPLKTYSSGMFSRLAFSIAVHLKPDVLLLDEILAVGDAAFQAKSRASMSELLDRSGTIVLVSHSLARIPQICSRAAWLDQGKIQMVDSADAVVEAYKAATERKIESYKIANSRPAGAKWPPRRQLEVVTEHLGGASLQELSVKYEMPVQRLQAWKNAFMKGALSGLRSETRKTAELARERRGSP